MPDRFERRARSWRTLIIVALTGIGLLAARAVLDAAPGILVFLALFAVPALVDFARDRRDWLEIAPDQIRWGYGRQSADIAVERIAHIRLERRLDTTMRARIVLDTAQKLVIPQACLPPADVLERSLRAVGIDVQHHPFSLL